MLLAVRNREFIDDPKGQTGDKVLVETVVMGAPTSAVANEKRDAAASTALVALALIAGGLLLAHWLWDRRGDPVFKPGSDYAALAGLILIAQAVERFLEPVSYLLLPAEKKEDAAKDATAEAVNAGADATTRGLAADAGDSVKMKANEAADAATLLEARKTSRKILFWALATVIGMLASSTWGLFIIESIKAAPAAGVAATKMSTADALLNIVVTGLVIGAGTQPFHALIKSLQKPTATVVAGSTATTG